MLGSKNALLGTRNSKIVIVLDRTSSGTSCMDGIYLMLCGLYGHVLVIITSIGDD